MTVLLRTLSASAAAGSAVQADNPFTPIAEQMCIGADIAEASPTQNLVRTVPENRRAAGERRGDWLRSMEVNPKFPGWQTNILIRAIGLFREAYSKMMMVRLYGSGLARDFM
jgi:hypothetical protein